MQPPHTEVVRHLAATRVRPRLGAGRPHQHLLGSLTDGDRQRAVAVVGEKPVPLGREVHGRGHLDALVSHAVDLEERQVLLLELLLNLFGGGNQKVQSRLASQTGLDPGQVSGLLARLAPLLLGALGQETKQNRVEESGLTGFLSTMMAQVGGSNAQGPLSQLLDIDGDGDVADDVGRLLGSLFKKR